MNKIKMIFTMIIIVAIGFLAGVKLRRLTYRQIKTGRIEACLKFYKEYRKTQDQKHLAQELKQIGLTPLDFQKIIDRLIYYRTKKSAMNQAMELLKAFRLGYNIKPERVVTISGEKKEPFRLDAEILAVFEKKPQLIEDAFKG